MNHLQLKHRAERQEKRDAQFKKFFRVVWNFATVVTIPFLLVVCINFNGLHAQALNMKKRIDALETDTTTQLEKMTQQRDTAWRYIQGACQRCDCAPRPGG